MSFRFAFCFFHVLFFSDFLFLFNCIKSKCDILKYYFSYLLFFFLFFFLLLLYFHLHCFCWILPLYFVWAKLTFLLCIIFIVVVGIFVTDIVVVDDIAFWLYCCFCRRLIFYLFLYCDYYCYYSISFNKANEFKQLHRLGCSYFCHFLCIYSFVLYNTHTECICVYVIQCNFKLLVCTFFSLSFSV